MSVPRHGCKTLVETAKKETRPDTNTTKTAAEDTRKEKEDKAALRSADRGNECER